MVNDTVSNSRASLDYSLLAELDLCIPQRHCIRFIPLLGLFGNRSRDVSSSHLGCGHWSSVNGRV